MTLMAAFLSLFVHGYRQLLSPWFGHNCRFRPTCSEYALEALREHGAARGLWLIVKRLMRCRPWAKAGYDPVPPKASAPEK